MRVDVQAREGRATAFRRAAAERDALLELIAVFTHDLSNPLQSITVLCELGLDEAEAGSDDLLRAQQCLEAAQRMRGLVQGLGGITRHTGACTLDALLERVLGPLARRFDRHHAVIEASFGALEGVLVPDGLEFVLLNVFLGLLAAAGEISALRAQVDLVAEPIAPGLARMRIVGRAFRKHNELLLLQLPARYTARVQACVEDLGSRFEQTPDGAMVLEFSLAQPPTAATP